jgi:hypothetical protein
VITNRSAGASHAMNVCVDAHQLESNICGGLENRAVGGVACRDAHDKRSGDMEDAKTFACRSRVAAFTHISIACTSDPPPGTDPLR